MISDPIIVPTPLGYNFLWGGDNDDDFSAKAVITRINDSSRGLLAEIEIWSSFMTDYPLLSGIRFNMTSERARTGLAKRLYSLYQKIDWQNVVEKICLGVIELSRQGEPVQELTSNDDIAPLDYLIAPIIPKGKPTAIFGDPGSGKSTLLLILAIVACLPWWDNPLHLIAPAVPSPILYLDYEADADDLRRQLKSFTDGHELGLTQLNYRRCSLPITEDLEAIHNYASAIKAKALFIDSTSLAAGGDLNRMDVATAYIRALRQLKMTSVSVSHTSKERDAKTKTIIGSVLFEAGFRSVWECRGQEDDKTLDIGLFHRKFNLGAKRNPLGYRITYNGQSNTIEWFDPSNVPEFVARMSHTKQILELLKRGGFETRQIAEELDISLAAASMALSRLAKKDQVIKNDKMWGLLYKE